HVLQTGPVWPTSLKRGIRGRAGEGHQMYEARHLPVRPSDPCSTPPPGPAGLTHATLGPRADQAPRPLHDHRSRSAGDPILPRMNSRSAELSVRSIAAV